MITMILNKMGNELGRIGEKVFKVDVKIAVRHFDWSMSYSTTATAQTENEPMSPNDRSRPRH
jgi:hypothetical protein